MKTFVLAAGLMAAIGLGALAVHADVAALWRQKFGPPLTHRRDARAHRRCERQGDLACAQDTLDAVAAACGPTTASRVPISACDARSATTTRTRWWNSSAPSTCGEGTYDLFAWYADSLAAHGPQRRGDRLVYRSLAIVPKLVDVRGKLAKLLVAQGRRYEALSLLESFDSDAARQGRQGYFEGPAHRDRVGAEAAARPAAPARPARCACRRWAAISTRRSRWAADGRWPSWSTPAPR